MTIQLSMLVAVDVTLLPLVKVVLVKWPGYETVVKGVFILSEMIKDQYIHLVK